MSMRTKFDLHYADVPNSWKDAVFNQRVEGMFSDQNELSMLVLVYYVLERNITHELSAHAVHVAFYPTHICGEVPGAPEHRLADAASFSAAKSHNCSASSSDVEFGVSA